MLPPCQSFRLSCTYKFHPLVEPLINECERWYWKCFSSFHIVPYSFLTRKWGNLYDEIFHSFSFSCTIFFSSHFPIKYIFFFVCMCMEKRFSTATLPTPGVKRNHVNIVVFLCAMWNVSFKRGMVIIDKFFLQPFSRVGRKSDCFTNNNIDRVFLPFDSLHSFIHNIYFRRWLSG